MIYLASPYSHPHRAVREQRFQAACAAAATLMRAGQSVFSPIIYGHPLTQHGLPGDWTFWERQARWYLERCAEVVVLILDGWETSQGVQAEIKLAGQFGTPVSYRVPVPPTTPSCAYAA